ISVRSRPRISPLSLHAALPISAFSPAVRVAVYEAIREASWWGVEHARPEHLLVGLLSVPDSAASRLLSGWAGGHQWFVTTTRSRSEEHTSELQSRENLVCRLLL